MRLLAVLFVLCSASAFATASLELEVGGGAHGLHDAAPTFTGRVGLDLFDWLTPSVRAMTVGMPNVDSSWAVLGDLHVHTPPHLFQAGIGAAVGFAVASRTGASTVAPYFMGDVGVRLNFWRMWVGLNVGASPLPVSWMAFASIGIAPFGRD
jgi:hypothetical protein